MATPAAVAVQAYKRRRRRRKLADQVAFADFMPFYGGSVFNFGITLQANFSANFLVLPAQGEFKLAHSAALDVGAIAIRDVTTGVTYFSTQPCAALGLVRINRLFPEGHAIRVGRGATCPAGNVTMLFFGPRSQTVAMGFSLFT